MILKESETVELKRSTSSLKQALISISAILNKHGGGELYFGVENSGQVGGQQVTESTLRQISQKISEGIEPKIFPLIEKVNLQGKVCIRIQFEGRERPYLRNPKIAEIFYFTKDIERWGSGLERIHKACLSNGVTVKFNLLKTGFLVTFERPELKSKDCGRTVEKTVGKTAEKILHAIKENPEITTLQLAELLGLSRRGIEWNLARLKKQGKIKRIGPARGGHWQVVEK
ncbi:RNA-binding domain-containing protein [Calditrichota bacterium GD2]